MYILLKQPKLGVTLGYSWVWYSHRVRIPTELHTMRVREHLMLLLHGGETFHTLARRRERSATNFPNSLVVGIVQTQFRTLLISSSSIRWCKVCFCSLVNKWCLFILSKSCELIELYYQTLWVRIRVFSLTPIRTYREFTPGRDSQHQSAALRGP